VVVVGVNFFFAAPPRGELSIENGNAPVAVPDFTRGGWQKLDGYRHAFAK